ncbi:phosphodiester glycosidase family protein [Frigidibacter sp. RF13]|uniref:phosphodiester glycosidase family protein n=1 Tax=Frigidibacter sp. RF13 TaxID=2997340 RepID=UPI003B6383C1
MKSWTRAAALFGLSFFALPAYGGDCRDMEFEEASYTVCEAAAGEDLRLFLNGPDGRPLGTFGAVQAQLASEGKRLAFAMNAGMYHDDRRPVGYYVEQGQEQAPLQRKPGPGNFGLHPNGVFCVTADGFAVIETLAFDAARPACLYASQSGPMLVLSGAIHPKFVAASPSVNIRNGVGVSRDGRQAYFVISDQRVNFHRFARFFRDGLNLPDALFFDGTISRLYAPDLGRDDFGLPMGPMIGLVVPSN